MSLVKVIKMYDNGRNGFDYEGYGYGCNFDGYSDILEYNKGYGYLLFHFKEGIFSGSGYGFGWDNTKGTFSYGYANYNGSGKHGIYVSFFQFFYECRLRNYKNWPKDIVEIL